MGRTQDPQRERFYDAEGCLTSQWWFWHPEREEIDARLPWDELVAFTRFVYADALRRPYRHQARTARVRPRLTIDRIEGPNSYAEPWCDRIAFTPSGCTTWIALHEVAHLLTSRRGESVHGWRFASVLRQMAGRHVDPRLEAMCTDVYAWYGVSDLPWRRRARAAEPYPWPPAEERDAAVRAMLVERAARFRARRAAEGRPILEVT
jgi:hypothetical protein